MGSRCRWIVFNASGAKDLILQGGKIYGGISTITQSGALEPGLDDIIGGYSLFENDQKLMLTFNSRIGSSWTG